MLNLPTKLYVFHPCRSNMISRMFNHDNLKVPWMAKFMVMDVGIPVDQKEIICPDWSLWHTRLPTLAGALPDAMILIRLGALYRTQRKGMSHSYLLYILVWLIKRWSGVRYLTIAIFTSESLPTSVSKSKSWYWAEYQYKFWYGPHSVEDLCCWLRSDRYPSSSGVLIPWGHPKARFRRCLPNIRIKSGVRYTSITRQGPSTSLRCKLHTFSHLNLINIGVVGHRIVPMLAQGEPAVIIISFTDRWRTVQPTTSSWPWSDFSRVQENWGWVLVSV